MSESDWLACRDPRGLIMGHGPMWNKVSPRKMRLFACGCCRLIWPSLVDERCRRAVEVGERLADDRAGPEEVSQTYTRTIVALGDSPPRTTKWHAVMASLTTLAANRFSNARALRVVDHTLRASPASRRSGLAEAQCDLYLDIVGGWSKPKPFDKAWMTPDVFELAMDIYDRRDFEMMPILGDALEKAGCSTLQILDHCRAPTAHARGCWVVDAVLGRGQFDYKSG
jgi:hypothetical protein